MQREFLLVIVVVLLIVAAVAASRRRTTLAAVTGVLGVLAAVAWVLEAAGVVDL